MRWHARYRGDSGVDVDVEYARVGFAANALAPQGYFTGRLIDVPPVRAALQALCAFATGAVTGAVIGSSADAWVTVDDDAVFFEAGAPGAAPGAVDPAGPWLRVRLLPRVFRRLGDVVPGTTTVPVPAGLHRALRRVGAGRVTDLAVAPGGVDPAPDGSVRGEHAGDEGAPPAAAAGPRAGATICPRPPAALARALRTHGPLAVVEGTTLRVPDPRAAALLVPLLPWARAAVLLGDDGDACGWHLDLDGVDVALTLPRGADDAEADHFVDVDGRRRSRSLRGPPPPAPRRSDDLDGPAPAPRTSP
jgi:hypothetical protein